MRSLTRRRAVAAAVLASAGACTYGPPQRIGLLKNYVSDSVTGRVAIAYLVHLHRPPTGLAAFPDGGVPRTLALGAEVHVCDRRDGRARLLAYVPAPREVRSAFSPWVLGWHGDTLVLRLGGSTGAETGQGEPVARFVGLLPGGDSVPSRDLPQSARPHASPGACERVLDSLRAVAGVQPIPPA